MMPNTKATQAEARPSSCVAASLAGAALYIPNTTLARKKSLTVFSPKRACPSRHAGLRRQRLPLLEGDLQTLDSAWLGQGVVRLHMQSSNDENRKIGIGKQMRQIEGELFLLSARSGELDFNFEHRFMRLCEDRTQLASELLLNQRR
jgi:hypothetical protein